jgi:acetyl esterase/lipase
MRALACLALGLAVTSLDAQSPRPIPYDVVAKLPAPPADHRLPYGTDSLQFGELRLPKGIAQNRPVVVLIHGGCWQGAYDIAHSRPMAAALADAGFAVWSIEYRRIGNPGGGWPNTFHDVALGTDFLRTIATTYSLDLSRVIAVGHSAGGQLVLWLGTRTPTAADANPLPLAGIVGLAPITDMARYGAAPGGCNSAVYQLMGGPPASFADRYAAVNPSERFPLRAPARLIHGDDDRTVLPEQSRLFASAANSSAVQVVPIANAAHFDVIAPISPAWPTIVATIRSLLTP